MELQARWEDLCRRLEVKNSDQIRVVWEILRTHYSEPHRHYHTLKHLKHCFEEFDSLPISSKLSEIELAIWFHDAIYDILSSDNEEKSSKLAEECCQKLGIPNAYPQFVRNLILDTKYHQSSDHSHNHFLDIDLSILGSFFDDYREYERNIRAEYSLVPWEVYIPGRIKILNSFFFFFIYKTIEFHDKYEYNARLNLQWAIMELQKEQVHQEILALKHAEAVVLAENPTEIRSKLSYQSLLAQNFKPFWIIDSLLQDPTWVHIFLLQDLKLPKAPDLVFPMDQEGFEGYLCAWIGWHRDFYGEIDLD